MPVTRKRQNTASSGGATEADFHLGSSSQSDLEMDLTDESQLDIMPSIILPASTSKLARDDALRSLAPDEARQATLKRQLDALQSEYNALMKRISQKKYALTPIGVLPPEVMGEMFVYAVGGEELGALQLSQVCSVWRTIVQSTPRAWSTITIRLTRPRCLNLATHYFKLSRSCPLHVAITEPPAYWKLDPAVGAFIPIAKLVRSNWGRIRIFRMYKMGGTVAKSFIDACFPDDYPSLSDNLDQESPESSQSSSLDISPLPSPIKRHSRTIASLRSSVRHIAFHFYPSHTPGQVVPDYADFRTMPYIFGDAREVTSFTLENALPSYDLPLFNFGSLRSIQIEEPHIFAYSTPVEKILDILAANPMLHAFVLAGNKATRLPLTQGETKERESIVHLPALRVLSLQSVDIPHILDNMCCPILEKLKLGNELGAVWDGCVATSLRNLIRRSGYPAITRLRINEITSRGGDAINDPNNEWACFDMMPHLLSFRCHHTPFPDSLLEQFIIPSAAPSPVHSSDDTDVEEVTSKVLCPRLIKLVFENCSFSGKALISLAKARAEAGNGSVALQELWTWQCENVLPKHERKLDAILGDRYTPTLQKEDTI